MSTAFVILKRESERVPGKNWRTLAGRPLYRWILDALAGVDALTRILIDTDAPELVAQYGLPADARFEVRQRAPALCGHAVTANALLRAHLPADGDAPWLMVHATSPFLRAATLSEALIAFSERQAPVDSLFGATRHQARFWDADGSPLNHDPARLLPTQELAPLYEENSALYVFTPSAFSTTGSRLGQCPRPYRVSRIEALDIDDEDDWALATLLAPAVLRAGA